MCVLVVNNDKYGKPLHAKSGIVIMGNFENKLYHKSQRYAPVLKYTSLRLLTAKLVGNKRILQQGDYKNALCNAQLPDDEFTYPYVQENEYWLLKKTLYGLRFSPHHWYNMIEGILLKTGIHPSPHYTCLIYCNLNNPSYSTCTQ